MLWGRQESARRTGAVRGWNMDDCMSTAAYMLGDDTHDERNAGWVIGCQGAKSEGAVQGQGVFCPTVTCRRWGEMEGMMMIYGRACREPPTTLTASWWAGYSGREGGAGRGEQRAEPRWRLEETGTRKPKKGFSRRVCPFYLTGELRGGRFVV